MTSGGSRFGVWYGTAQIDKILTIEHVRGPMSRGNLFKATRGCRRTTSTRRTGAEMSLSVSPERHAVTTVGGEHREVRAASDDRRDFLPTQPNVRLAG